MELTEAIEKRRSVRKYQDTPVPEDAIDSMLEAGCLAPSGGNIQPWIFGVVTDPQVVKKIRTFSPGMIGAAPCVIACCSDRELAFNKGGELGRDTMAVMDVCFAAQNMVLKAVDLGLGTCFIKSYNEVAVRRILKLPEHIALDVLIMVGYPVAQPNAQKRKPLAQVKFINEWSE